MRIVLQQGTGLDCQNIKYQKIALNPDFSQ